MSLLNRYGANRRRHIDDSRFADLWSRAVASGETAIDPHLASCAHCQSRYAAFTDWLERIHDDARDDAEEAFPAERLTAQQAQVMRRLEALERPARVIMFPRFARPATSTQGHAQRWIAAAAAAGLVIGLAAGQMFDVRQIFRPVARTPQMQSARVLNPPNQSRPQIVPASASSVSDETLFFGADPSRTSERLPMLQAIDDITPRARDLDGPR